MFQTGDRIGPYILKSQIGRGAFGVVWLAEETTFLASHKVALKLPNSAIVNIAMIRQEAALWEQVKGHPNILPIIKADVIDGQIYIASEYAPDGSLADWLAQYGGAAPNQYAAVEMTKGILNGLAHLHSKSVIHRDLKPENILLQGETPRIADFGIARTLEDTQSLQISGTPNYMAPEGFNGERSVQTDVWAVGVIFYQMLTGFIPFPQGDFLSIVKAIVYDEPQIDRQKLSENLYLIINKALQKDVSKRYQTASEMIDDLRKIDLISFDGWRAAETLPDVQTPMFAETLPDTRSPMFQDTQKTAILEQTVPFGEMDTNAGKNQQTLLLENHPKPLKVEKNTNHRKWLGGTLSVLLLGAVAYLGINSDKFLPNKSQSLTALTANTNIPLKKDDSYNRSLWAEWALMLEDDKYEEIMKETTAEIGRNPNNVIAYRMRATAYYGLNKAEEARMDVREVMRLSANPAAAEEYESRCYALKIINKPDEALADCTKAIELDSQLALAYNIRGTIYHQKKMYDLAIAEYSKAIELSPRKTFFENRALAYRALNNTKSAAKDEREAAALAKYLEKTPRTESTSSKSQSTVKAKPTPQSKPNPRPVPKMKATPNADCVFTGNC